MKRADTYHFLRSLRSTAVLVVATAALLASVLTSCSKQAEEPVPVPHDGQIRIDTEIASSPQGAAPQSASQADNNAGTKAVLTGPVVDGGTGSKATLTDIRLLREDGTAAATVFTSFATATNQIYANRAASGALSFTPAQYYKMDNSTASYIAVYPQGAIMNDGIGQGLKWAIDGATDILISKVYDAGKYSAPATGTPMVFEHKLAQLRVVCTADPSVALNVVQAVWGKITKIELMSAWQIYQFYPSQNPPYMGGMGDAPLRLWDPSYTSQDLAVALARNTSTPCAAGMFVPHSGTTALRLRVTSSVGAAVEVSVQLKDGATPKGFEAGKIHTVTLTFGAADKPIAVTTTSIQNWDEGGTGSGDGIVFEDVFTPSEGIIDMNYAELVKADGSYSITSTRRSYNPNTYNASNADNNGGYLDIREKAYSEPAYYKFEVAKTDETGTKSWTAAWDACKAKAPAGAWRLPRGSELALMKVNNAELEKTPGFTSLTRNIYYWSGTEGSAAIAWLMEYPTVLLQTATKGSGYRVRCVRELDVSLPAVEDYYYSDGTFSRDLHPTKTVEGVVYWVDPANPKHFKIVGMDEPPANWESNGNSAGSLKWSTERVVRNVSSVSDGKANTLTLMKLSNAATAYPAAKWCYTQNAGVTVPAATGVTTSDAAYKWYLPAKNELQHLFCAYWGVAPTIWASSDPSFSAASGYPAAWKARFTTTPLSDANSYWSSSENSADGSWCVYFKLGTTDRNGKTFDSYRVRCVREITL